MQRVIKLFKYLFLFIYYKSIKKNKRYYDVIYDAVKNLGGVYIKLVQFLCLRTDLFPDDQKLAFLTFYDQVPIENLDLNKILEKELGEEKLKNFQKIEYTPFASGTFGQVYKAKLNDGRDVVIKIKRKDLIPKLRIDFFLLKLATKLFTLLYYQPFIDANGLMKEFEETTMEELDYEKEAKNAKYFYDIYRNHETVFIPKTYLELCTKTVLVQEFVDGIAVTDLIRMKQDYSYEEYNTYLEKEYRTSIRFVISQIAYELALQGFQHDKFYADPHPGNIKILKDNRFAFIDFGIVGSSPKNSLNYYNIIKLMVEKAEERDMKQIGKEFLEWGANRFYKYLKTLDDHFGGDNKKLSDELVNKYELLLESKREKFRQIETDNKENFVQIYLDIIRTGQFLNVKVPEGLLSAMKTVAIYKAWNTFLDPTYYHMRHTYSRIVETVNPNTLQNIGEEKENTVTIEESIEGFLDWIGKVAESDVPFYNRLKVAIGEFNYV